MSQSVDFVWPQGEDLKVDLIYKEGTTPETAVVVPLTTGYSVRMDIVSQTNGERLYTFNSADIPDVDPVLTGAQADTQKEGTLSSGAGGTPNISIAVPRALTLPTGVIYTKMKGVPPQVVFNYDVFLRNTTTDKQVKVLKGTITVEESYTLWV